MQTAEPERPISIVPFADRHRTAFKNLNAAWIQRHFRMEAADYHALDHPETHILAPGGQIFVAVAGDDAVGVCALIRRDEGRTFELAKMAVADAAQGRGIGEQLARTAIAWARTRGARRLYLESNTILEPAIRLYRKLGFIEVTGHASPYARSNIQMELTLQ